MQSILNMLATISSNPHIDEHIRAQAAWLHRKISGAAMFNLFGGL